MRRYLWRFAEVTALVLLIVLLCIGFVWVLDYILPFVIGGFLAILLLPLVRVLERRGINRTASVITVLVGIVILLLAITTYVVVAVAREATMWTESITDQFGLVQTWFNEKVLFGKALFQQLPKGVSDQLASSTQNLVSHVQTILTGLSTFVIHSITSLPESMFIVVIALIATYFMLVNRDRMYRVFLSALPPGWSSKVNIVSHDMMRAFAGTIRAQVVLMLMSAVLGIVGMWICGIQYAVILGLLFGVTGLVPILGSAILTIPWALGALLVGDIPLAIKILLLQLAISLIRHAVEPKILADSVGLDTLSTLFALYVGMKVMGVIGLFFGPIALIGIKSMLRIRLFIDFFPQAEGEKGPSAVNVPAYGGEDGAATRLEADKRGVPKRDDENAASDGVVAEKTQRNSVSPQ